MKISGTKKLILICLSLFIALTVLFASTLLVRNTYAQVSPDGLSAYADEGGEETPDVPEVPDDDEIAPPIDPDPDPNEPDWSTEIQQITMEFGKLSIGIDAWMEAGLSTRPAFNPNPNGIYDGRPDLIDVINQIHKLRPLRR